MIWIGRVPEAASWAAWLWEHRETFAAAIARAGDVAQGVLTDPDGAVRRVGNAIVFGQPDGGTRVLAFVEQMSPRVEHIQQAVDGLQAGQAALSLSLSSLRCLSMATLGISGLTAAVLVGQFVALNRRLTALQKQIAGLEKKIDAQIVGKLNAGLALLQAGTDFQDAGKPGEARVRFDQAREKCVESMMVFTRLVRNELNQKRVDREELRLLARHLAVAVMGVAGCEISVGQDEQAFSRSGEPLDLLRQVARRVFHDTVAHDPAPFLMPAMREHGVTIDLMARLYQQARDAGALDAGQAPSAAAWFEEHREAIFRARQPWLWSGRRCLALRGRLQEAVAAVEETSRVVGLSRLVEEVRASGCNTRAVLQEYRRRAQEVEGDDELFAAWGIRPGQARG